MVGGGTAGWMSALVLASAMVPGGGRVVLVEDPEIPTVGVGEATVPPFVAFLRSLGLDEGAFMRECGATYKLAIRFDDWLAPGHRFWHPFGSCGGSIDGLQVFHFWLKGLRAGKLACDYTDHSLQVAMCDGLRSPRPLEAASDTTRRGDYAYHLDAAAFASHLREHAVARGARHVRGRVREVVLDAGGRIARLETDAAGALEADLYLDCTGFRSLLLGDALGEPWVDESALLPCDRALVVSEPPDPSAPPYTRATALDAGWAWQIPLAHRTGRGYVYSSAFSDGDAALRSLANHLGAGPEGLSPRELRFRVGRRERAWVGNCVAVGLASGFYEPLESTAIHVVQKSLEHLLRYFPDTALDPVLARRFNDRMRGVWDEVRDFVVLHYGLTRREDTAFWRACGSMQPTGSAAELLAQYDATGLVEPAAGMLFPDTSWFALLAGMDRLPASHLPQADLTGLDAALEILEGIRARNADAVRPLPTHGDLLRHLHEG